MKTAIILILIASLIFIIGASSCQQQIVEQKNVTVAQNNTIIPPVAEEPKTYTVIIENYMFRPYNINIEKDSTITWINKDTPDAHSVTLNDQSISERIESGKNVSITFNKAGQYAYHCSVHGESGYIYVK